MISPVVTAAQFPSTYKPVEPVEDVCPLSSIFPELLTRQFVPFKRTPWLTPVPPVTFPVIEILPVPVSIRPLLNTTPCTALEPDPEAIPFTITLPETVVMMLLVPIAMPGLPPELLPAEDSSMQSKAGPEFVFVISASICM